MIKLTTLTVGVLLVTGHVAGAASITFAQLGSGGTTAGSTAGNGPIPAGYQPLLSGYPNDGGNLGITMTFGDAQYATGANSTVYPYFGGTNGAVLYDGGSGGETLTFSSPINLGNIEFSNFNGGQGFTIEFAGFNAGSSAAVFDQQIIFNQASANPGPNAGGYDWQTAALAGTGSVTSLVISGSALDQIGLIEATATSVPEPGSVIALMSSLVGLLGLSLLFSRTQCGRAA